MSEPRHSSGLTSADSGTAAKRNAYRKASAAFGLISGGLALVTLPYVYFLLVPRVYISVVLMIVGSVLVGTRKATSGALLILFGGFFGGFMGLPLVLWMLLATIFGGSVYGLPLLPLGLLLPMVSFVLALMSREQSEVKLLH